jgi:hypothetical protein
MSALKRFCVSVATLNASNGTTFVVIIDDIRVRPAGTSPVDSIGRMEVFHTDVLENAQQEAREWDEFLNAAPTQGADARPVAIPDGYVLMPRALTAANGAKGLLSGEFAEHVEIQNPEYGDDEDGDKPETHRIDVPVGWDTIKRIYAMAVEHLAILQANGAKK